MGYIEDPADRCSVPIGTPPRLCETRRVVGHWHREDLGLFTEAHRVVLCEIDSVVGFEALLHAPRDTLLGGGRLGILVPFALELA